MVVKDFKSEAAFFVKRYGLRIAISRETYYGLDGWPVAIFAIDEGHPLTSYNLRLHPLTATIVFGTFIAPFTLNFKVIYGYYKRR